MKPHRAASSFSRLRRGRAWLALFLPPLAASQAAIFHVASHTALAAPIHCAIVNSSLWMAVLLLALWHRHDPARIVLAALLLLGVAGQVIFLPEAFAGLPGFHVRHFLGMTIAGPLSLAVALIGFPPLRRLTTWAPLRFRFQFPVFSPHYRCLAR